MAKGKKKPERSIEQILGEALGVTRQVVVLLYGRAPVVMTLLGLLTVLSALLPYWQSRELRNVLDAVRSGHTGPDLFEHGIGLLGAIACVLIVEIVIRNLVQIADTHFPEIFNTYFPKIRTRFGLLSFLAGDERFEQLQTAQEAQYDVRFIVVGQLNSIRLAIVLVVNLWIVAYYVPKAGFALTLAFLTYAVVGVWNTVVKTLQERADWSLLAERSHYQNGFGRKETLKGYLAFGIAETLIEHLENLSRRIFEPRRAQIYRSMWVDLIAALVLLAMYGVAGSYILEELASGKLTVGWFAFLVVIVLGVGTAMSLFVSTVSQQALSFDRTVALFAFMRGEGPELRILGGSAPFRDYLPATIELDALGFSYPGEKPRPVFQDLSLTIRPGLTFLLGQNGIGKTTFFDLLKLRLPIDRGEIRIAGQSIAETDKSQLNRFVRDLPQQVLELRGTIRESLAFAGGYANPRECPELTLWHALDLACLGERVKQFKRGLDEPLAQFHKAQEDLSGGQYRKLNLAMIFMALLTGRVRVIVLDEPYNALDPFAAAKIHHNMVEFLGSGISLVISTHHVRDIPRHSEVVFLYREDDAVKAIGGSFETLLATSAAFREYCNLTTFEESAPQ